MELIFYATVTRIMEPPPYGSGNKQGTKVRKLRVTKTTEEPPTQVEANSMVVRIPIEIPLELFEPITATKMKLEKRDLKVEATEDPLEGTRRLAEELSGDG